MAAATITFPDKVTGDQLQATEVNQLKAGINDHAQRLDNAPAQARLAQLNRVPATPTTTATLTSESPTEYGTIHSGVFTVDAANCVVGQGFAVTLAKAVTGIQFINVPPTQPETYSIPFVAGTAYDVVVLVRLEKIHVVLRAI